MENKRWFQEKMDEVDELYRYIGQVFIEYLDEMGYRAENWIFLTWENLDNHITITARHTKDTEDDVFWLNMEYFYEDNMERRRNMMKDEYAKKQEKERLEKERKEQERLEQKRRQFHKLKQELGEE